MTMTNTDTTRAMPNVVASVERQRTRKLRMLYFSGMAMSQRRIGVMEWWSNGVVERGE